jgi:hypothetical protein
VCELFFFSPFSGKLIAFCYMASLIRYCKTTKDYLVRIADINHYEVFAHPCSGTVRLGARWQGRGSVRIAEWKYMLFYPMTASFGRYDICEYHD